MLRTFPPELNPALGNISPDEFILVAEQTGLIIPIGKFVLMEALTTVATWQQSYGPDFRISVNLGLAPLYGCQDAIQADPFIAEESAGAVVSNA
ncbi:MAG: EAL domain-containing protein [Motiliproteus sp.]